MADTAIIPRSLPLTDLSEDEAFRDVVRDFADEGCARSCAQMDEEAKIPRELIDACFELGIMGIEIPEAYGGAGAHASSWRSSRSRSWRASTPSVAVLVDVQNTLVNNALLRWGTEEQKAKYLPQLATEVGRRLRALRGGLRLGRLRARVPRRRTRATTTTSTARSSGSPTRPRRSSSSCSRPSTRPRATRGSPRSSSRRTSPGSRSARRRTSSASGRPRPAS